MKICKKILKEDLTIQDIICNVCGEKIHKNEFEYFDDYLSIEKQWGYGSEFDGKTHCIDICGKCYKEIFSKLKHPPNCDTNDEG